MIVNHFVKIVAGNHRSVISHATVCVESNFTCKASIYKPFGFAATISVPCQQNFAAVFHYMARRLFAGVRGELRIGDKIYAVQTGIDGLIYKRLYAARDGARYPIPVLFLRGEESAQLSVHEKVAVKISEKVNEVDRSAVFWYRQKQRAVF